MFKILESYRSLLLVTEVKDGQDGSSYLGKQSERLAQECCLNQSGDFTGTTV